MSSLNILAQLQTSDTPDAQFNQKYHKRFFQKIGLAQFHSIPVINNKQVTFLSHTIIKKLSNESLDIFDFYMYWRWEYLFRSIKKMNHKQVEIYEPYYKSVLKDIGGVCWGGLQKIRLNLANTASVEAIEWLDCPCLEEIWVTLRVRTVSKPFVKAFFPNLKKITVESDIVDHVDFSRTTFGYISSPLGIYVRSNNFSRKKRAESMVDYAFFSKIGSRGHLKAINCGQNEDKNQIKFKFYSPIKIFNSVKDQVLKQHSLSDRNTAGHNYVYGKVIECLFERKFEMVVDQPQQQRRELEQVVLFEQQD